MKDLGYSEEAIGSMVAQGVVKQHK
jgi:hypothetical protein